MLQVSFSRVYLFSAAHRLHSDTLSDESNVEVYDKCNNPNGHGHDYRLEVTLKGQPDPDTGMIYPMEKFDQAIKTVLEPIDYRHLNFETDYFKDHISTGEIIIQFLWNKIDTQLPAGLLHHITLWETNNNYFELGKES